MNNEGMPWVIFDIDGTLANIKDRLHHIETTPKDWEKFNAEMISDQPKLEILALYRMCADAGYHIMIVTGRFEKYRKMTINWLRNCGVEFECLYMRSDGDYRSDNEVKQDIFDEHIKDKYILFAVDDRDRVVEMWRENGLTCLQVQKGDY